MKRMCIGATALLGLTAVGCYSGARDGDGLDPTAAPQDGDDAAEEASAEAGDGDGDESGEDGGGAETGAPSPDGEGPSEFPIGRRIRRMTADQFAASLTVATGQSWPEYPTYAATMGKADYADITSQDRTLSVTFDKFAHDAALYSCRAAIDADADNGGNVLLRHATADSQNPASVRENVAYLLLRFLAVDAAADDVRIDPYANLLLAPAADDLTPELLRERWTAVCVALATHPDFVAY